MRLYEYYSTRGTVSFSGCIFVEDERLKNVID